MAEKKVSNLIADLSFDFSISIIELCKILNERKEFVIAKQLLRSATSIGANVEEAEAALTKREFINKLSIAAKEAREARYWLRLILSAKLIELDLTNYLSKAVSIINVLTKIIKTSQQRLTSNI